MTVNCTTNGVPFSTAGYFFINWSESVNATATLENEATGQINTFWLTWIGFILSILVFAVAYLSGKTYSQMVLTSAIGQFIVFMVTVAVLGTGMMVFIYAAIVLVLLGMILKYVGM